MTAFISRATVTLVLTASALSLAGPADAVIGEWEGESKCTVRDSPCRDEHVIYTIRADTGGALTMQADKVVDRERQNMGTLPCKYDATNKRLTCVHDGPKPGDWAFVISGDAMTGTLTLRNDRQLFRRIQARRVKKP